MASNNIPAGKDKAQGSDAAMAAQPLSLAADLTELSSMAHVDAMRNSARSAQSLPDVTIFFDLAAASPGTERV